MYFLLYYALACGLRLLVIQLTITALLIPFLGSVSYHAAIGFSTMPVTTRSRAKLLTSSAPALSILFPTGSKELSDISSPLTPKLTSLGSNNFGNILRTKGLNQLLK
jgi:hypothetical protein